MVREMKVSRKVMSSSAPVFPTASEHPLYAVVANNVVKLTEINFAVAGSSMVGHHCPLTQCCVI